MIHDGDDAEQARSNFPECPQRICSGSPIDPFGIVIEHPSEMKRREETLGTVVRKTGVPLALLVGLSLGGSAAAQEPRWIKVPPQPVYQPFTYQIVIDPQAPATLYTACVVGPLWGETYKTTDGGLSWRAILPGLVNSLAIDSVTPTTLYASFGSVVLKTTDGGGTWIGTGQPGRAVAIDPVTPTTLYAANRGVFKSTDGGGHWSSAGLVGHDVRALAIDPRTPSTLLAGMAPETSQGRDLYPGGVSRSTDGGASWGTPALADQRINALAIDPETPSTVYTADGPVAFKSTDAGSSWRAMGVPAPYVRALAIDPVNPSFLYAGTNRGVFRSADGGGSWTAINAGLTNLDVVALAVDPVTAATLYASTYGGLFVLDQSNTAPPVLTLPADMTVEAGGPDGAVVTFAATAMDDWDGALPVTSSPPSGSRFPLGTTTVTALARDSVGNQSRGSFRVTVRDTTAPEITRLTASPASLWPPNHALVRVGLTAQVSEAADPRPRTHILSVSSNRPDDRAGRDWIITGDLTLSLRAKRSRGGAEHLYTITVESRDASGNASTKAVVVAVSRDALPCEERPHPQVVISSAAQRMRPGIQSMGARSRSSSVMPSRSAGCAQPV